jgi:hypothetical protein
VPHVGLRCTLLSVLGQRDACGEGGGGLWCLGEWSHLTKSRKGSKRFDRAATSDIVVLSPPGMIRASQRESSSGVRTSENCHVVLSALSFDLMMAAA